MIKTHGASVRINRYENLLIILRHCREDTAIQHRLILACPSRIQHVAVRTSRHGAKGASLPIPSLRLRYPVADVLDHQHRRATGEAVPPGWYLRHSPGDKVVLQPATARARFIFSPSDLGVRPRALRSILLPARPARPVRISLIKAIDFPAALLRQPYQLAHLSGHQTA